MLQERGRAREIAFAARRLQRAPGFAAVGIALGSSRSGVLLLALREGASVPLVGSILGVPLALLLASRIRKMLFGVAPFDPTTYATY